MSGPMIDGLAKYVAHAEINVTSSDVSQISATFQMLDPNDAKFSDSIKSLQTDIAGDQATIKKLLDTPQVPDNVKQLLSSAASQLATADGLLGKTGQDFSADQIRQALNLASETLNSAGAIEF